MSPEWSFTDDQTLTLIIFNQNFASTCHNQLLLLLITIFQGLFSSYQPSSTFLSQSWFATTGEFLFSSFCPPISIVLFSIIFLVDITMILPVVVFLSLYLLILYFTCRFTLLWSSSSRLLALSILLHLYLSWLYSPHTSPLLLFLILLRLLVVIVLTLLLIAIPLIHPRSWLFEALSAIPKTLTRVQLKPKYRKRQVALNMIYQNLGIPFNHY